MYYVCYGSMLHTNVLDVCLCLLPSGIKHKADTRPALPLLLPPAHKPKDQFTTDKHSVSGVSSADMKSLLTETDT